MEQATPQNTTDLEMIKSPGHWPSHRLHLKRTIQNDKAFAVCRWNGDRLEIRMMISTVWIETTPERLIESGWVVD